MYQNVLIAGAVIIIVASLLGALYLGNWLARKKINVSDIIDKAKSEIPVFEQVKALLTKLLPPPYQAMANMFVTAIKKPVEVSEALFQAGQLTDDQRKTKAIELINAMLVLEKVTITEKVSNAISLAVDLAAILFLPKSHVPIPADAADTAAA